MIVTIVNIKVKPEHIDDFIEITRYNHENSIKEDGNVRFDVLQDTDEPTHFTLYEVFEDEEAIAFHKTTEHYKKWNAAMNIYMSAQRTKIVNRAIAFTE